MNLHCMYSIKLIVLNGEYMIVIVYHPTHFIRFLRQKGQQKSVSEHDVDLLVSKERLRPRKGNLSLVKSVHLTVFFCECLFEH